MNRRHEIPQKHTDDSHILSLGWQKCTSSEKATFGTLAAHMLFQQHNTELAKVKYHNRVPTLNI